MATACLMNSQCVIRLKYIFKFRNNEKIQKKLNNNNNKLKKNEDISEISISFDIGSEIQIKCDGLIHNNFEIRIFDFN